MRDRVCRIRDLVVAALAKASLILILGLLGAFFVGTGAQSQAVSTNASVSSGAEAQTASSDLLSGVRPVGLVLGVLVLGSGIGVLLVGAFKPQTRRRYDLS